VLTDWEWLHAQLGRALMVSRGCGPESDRRTVHSGAAVRFYIVVNTLGITAVEINGDTVQYVEAFESWNELLSIHSRYMSEYATVKVERRGIEVRFTEGDL